MRLRALTLALAIAGCNLLAGIDEPAHAPMCGDGTIDRDEQCDDQNHGDGDGCDHACHLEPGYLCAGQPSRCAPTCGDGVPAGDEQCDDGNRDDGDGCDRDCRIEPGFTCEGACHGICGDGLVVPGETCDDANQSDGDGCDHACQTEPGFTCPGQPSACVPTCGDGKISEGEACDDGNILAGDCCSPTCQIEPGCIYEVEPNDTTADADARAYDPVSVQLLGSGRIHGALEPAGDTDYFALGVDLFPQVVRVETFDASGRDCVSADTQIVIAKATPFIPLYTDGDGGIGACSAIVAGLAGGAYYVGVGGAQTPAYLLDVAFIPSAGAEIEPNDTPSLATPIPGADVYISADHQDGADIDWYSITVPEGASVRAEIIEADASTCAAMSTELALFDPALAVLADTLGGGRGGCSRIDGTGSTPLHAAAHALPAGTYYLRVTAPVPAVPQAQFAYRLTVVLR